MKITRFKTDASKEQEGVWVEIGDGARIRVARAGNARWKAYFRKILKPYRRQIRADILPEEVADKLVVDALAHTVLLGWDGLEDAKGKKISYSVAKAQALLTEYPDFRALVEDASSEAEAYREAELEDAEGNSAKS